MLLRLKLVFWHNTISGILIFFIIIITNNLKYILFKSLVIMLFPILAPEGNALGSIDSNYSKTNVLSFSLFMMGLFVIFLILFFFGFIKNHLIIPRVDAFWCPCFVLTKVFYFQKPSIFVIYLVYVNVVIHANLDSGWVGNIY